MLKRFLKNRIASFERDWDYDSAYMKEVIDASPAAMVKIMLAQPLFGHRDGAPPEAWFAAAATAVKAADCAPCFELGLKMARRGGIPEALIQAVAAGDEAAMSEAAALGHTFARAVLARDLEQIARLRAKIIRAWGRKAVVALSTAIATASFYPTLKYGMAAAARSADSLPSSPSDGRRRRDSAKRW